MDEAVATLLTTLEVEEVVRRAGALLRRHFGQTRLAIWRVPGASPAWPGPEPPGDRGRNAPESRAAGPAEPPDAPPASPTGSGPRLQEATLIWCDDPRGPAIRTPKPDPLPGTSMAAAIAAGRMVPLENLPRDAAVRTRFADAAELARLGYGAAASFPLVVEGRVLGALQIAHPPPDGILCQCFQPADRVARLIAVALHNSEMVAEVRRLNQRLRAENTTLRLEVEDARQRFVHVGRSPAMAAVLEQVRLAAPTDTTILIRGETGTGKEGIARLVHELSPRARGPFVAVNLGALPESLVESELFGHVRGAFTGAHRERQGRFQQARGGTLFLDEVGDAPLAVQVKLLRALQEREVTPVGGEATDPVDVRVVAATNRPLEDLVEAGQFRQDLYYRLNIFPIQVPALRDRRADIRPLAEHLLARLAAQLHRPVPTAPAEFWDALGRYPWPGNVRELASMLERALLLSPPERLVLPSDLRATEAAATAPPATSRPVAAPLAAGALPASSNPDPFPTFEEAVRTLLAQALERCEGRVYGPKGAAALLGLKPTTLQGKLRRYGLR